MLSTSNLSYTTFEFAILDSLDNKGMKKIYNLEWNMDKQLYLFVLTKLLFSIFVRNVSNSGQNGFDFGIC